MNKLADIFQETGIPYPMLVVNVERGVSTKFGTSTVVLVNYENEEYKWYIDDEKFSRTFPKDVFAGDKINVTKKVHPKNSNWSYYQTEIIGRESGATNRSEQSNHGGGKDRDATQFRMALAGVTQALISSASYDVEEKKDLNKLKEKAVEICMWVRERAEEMYQESLIEKEKPVESTEQKEDIDPPSEAF